MCLMLQFTSFTHFVIEVIDYPQINFLQSLNKLKRIDNASKWSEMILCNYKLALVK